MSHIEFWRAGVAVGMHLSPLDRSTMGLLFFNLQGLRMLKLLGFVHIHEEVLQQNLSLHQVVGIHFLVDQGCTLPFTLSILKQRPREDRVRVIDLQFEK